MVVTEAPKCPNQPFLTENFNLSLKQWDILWYDTKGKGLTLVANLTASDVFSMSVRAPTISYDQCKWAGEFQNPDGSWQIRTYSFGMGLIGKIVSDTSYVHPEFVLTPADKLIVVREKDGRVFETDVQGKNFKDLNVNGWYPHSLVVPGGYRLAMTDLNGSLEILMEDGTVVNYNQPCARAEWVPDGTAVACRNGNNTTIFPVTKKTTLQTTDIITSTLGSVAFNPSKLEEAGVSSSSGLYYSDEVLKNALMSKVNPKLVGWGSDWGGTPTAVTIAPSDMITGTNQALSATPSGELQPEPAEEVKIIEDLLNPKSSSVQTETSSAASTTPTVNAPVVCSDYQGVSVVECLAKAHMDHTFAARAQLAVQYKIVSTIDDYRGTAEQNTALLNLLRAAP